MKDRIVWVSKFSIQLPGNNGSRGLSAEGGSRRLHLVKQWRDEKRVREPGAGRYCAIPTIISPEVQGRLFNHTTDYAITVRRPAEEEGGNLSLEPRSLVFLNLPVQLFVRLLVSSVLPQ